MPDPLDQTPNCGALMILYCAADLIWASKIKGQADALSIPCRPVRNLEMLEARLVDSPVRALILDLEAEHAMVLLDRLRANAKSDAERAIRVVAFGPHVEVDRLRVAKARGADAVMARGAFNRQLASLLSALNVATETESPIVDALED